MSAELRLRLVGSEQAMAALAARRGAATVAIRRALSDSVNLLQRKIALNLTGAVLRVKTGRLRQSMQTFISDASGGVGTNVEYARIHEYGGTIRPHQIPVPTSTGSLRIIQHPGATVPARPYMRPALEGSREDIRKIFVTRLSAALKGAS